jgi:hypothetical protein
MYGLVGPHITWGDVTPKAPWCHAGDALLSKAVNAAIGFKPLYALMKVAAKQVYKGTAERNGVPWDATVRQLQSTPQACMLPACSQPFSTCCTLSPL